MHINCKCGFCLTNKELFLTKKWRNTGQTDYQDLPIFDITLGSFITDKHWWDGDHIIHVNRDDLNVGVVPLFEEGMGCCDINDGVNCPHCKTEIGEALYDCYITKRSVILYKTKINVSHPSNKNRINRHTKYNKLDDHWAKMAMKLRQKIYESLHDKIIALDFEIHESR